MDSIKGTINKGVPTDAPIALVLDDLKEVSFDKEKLSENFYNSFLKFNGYIKKMCGNIDCGLYGVIELHLDKNTLEKSIIWGGNSIINTLMMIFNIKNYSEEITYNNVHEFLNNDVSERIDYLSSIKDEHKLRKNFPILYDRYLEYKKQKQQQDEIKRVFNQKKLNKSCIDSLLIAESNISRHDYSFEGFKKDYISFFRNLIVNFDKITQFGIDNPIELDGIIDKEKFQLLLAYDYFAGVNRYFECDDLKSQAMLFYVSHYFAENPERKNDDITELKVSKRICGKVFVQQKEYYTPKKLYEEYKKVLIKHPKLQVIDFDVKDFNGMVLEEVDEFMVEYLKDLNANWDLIPNGTDGDKEIYDKALKSTIDRLPEAKKKEHQERISDLFIEKKELYDSIDPYYRVLGKNTFDGYIGYVYKNGTVILDKLYDNAKSGKITEGAAIYVMNISEFYELSHLTKTKLIQENLCRRIIHKGDWKTKVREVIESQSVADSVKEVARLIKEDKLKKCHD